MTKQEIIDAIPDNWKYAEHNGFVHIKDEAGKIRIRIDPPDKVTQYPRIHVYDNDGNLLDSLGNIVDRKSPDGHIPYKNQESTMIQELLKKIEDSYYWDARVKALDCNYFGDEVGASA